MAENDGQKNICEYLVHFFYQPLFSFLKGFYLKKIK